MTLPHDDAPFPTLTGEEKQALSDRYGLEGRWIELGPQGWVHRVYRVGEAVVRLPRNHPECICDTLTEAVALEALQGFNFPTPRLIAFDDRRDLLPVPFQIVEYFNGRPVEDLSQVPPALPAMIGSLLATLHRDVVHVPDPNGWLDDVDLEETSSELARACDRRLLSESQKSWSEKVIHAVSPHLKSEQESVFVHNDVHELNILVGEVGTVLIDWGDAGWGDPAHDFSTLPPAWITGALQSYETVRPLSDSVRARIMWNQLGLALRKMQEPGLKRERAYARLKELQRAGEAWFK